MIVKTTRRREFKEKKTIRFEGDFWLTRDGDEDDKDWEDDSDVDDELLKWREDDEDFDLNSDLNDDDEYDEDLSTPERIFSIELVRPFHTFQFLCGSLYGSYCRPTVNLSTNPACFGILTPLTICRDCHML